MAMVAVHGPTQRGLPPPLGPAKAKVKGKVLRFPSVVREDKLSPIVKGIRASMPAHQVDDLEFACEVRLLKAKKAKPSKKYKAASGNSGGGGDKSWRPRWNHSFGGGIAVWNLLANAELMTPMGRRFIPDPKYKGDGLSPPQKDSFVHYFDNVYDLSAVRAKAQSATLHSERSRGRVHTVVGEPPPLDVPIQQTSVSPVVQAEVEALDPSRTKDWGKLDLSAFGWYSANDDTLSGDTDDTPDVSDHDQRLENSAYFAYHVTTTLSIDGYVHLSRLCLVEMKGESNVVIHYHLPTGCFAVRRMSLADFADRIDDGGIPLHDYVWVGNAASALTDEAAYEILGLDCWKDWDTNEGFETWSQGDLEKLWHMRNHFALASMAEINAVFDGDHGPATEKEKYCWSLEYVTGLRTVTAKLSHLQEAYDLGEDPAMLHMRVIQRHATGIKLVDKPVHREMWRPKTKSEEARYNSHWLKLMLDDQWRLKYKLACRPMTQRVGLEDKAVWLGARQWEFKRNTVVRRTTKDAVSVGVSKIVKLLNTPVTQLFKRKAKVQRVNPPPVLVEDERVDAAAEAMALRKIITGSVHEGAYGLSWLGGIEDKKIDLNKVGDINALSVALAIEAVEQDVPTEEYSEGGIFLGKSVQLPRTEAGIILLNKRVPPLK